MKTTIYLELEIEVAFTAHKASRGHRDRYGAPEEPDEDAYVEVDEVTYNGQPLSLAKEDLEKVQREVDDYDPEDWDKE